MVSGIIAGSNKKFVVKAKLLIPDFKQKESVMNVRYISLPIVLILCSLFQVPSTYSKHAEPTARITETGGEVYKKGFVDWEKDLWKPAQAAQAGEELQEGMQILCGDHSRAALACGAASVRCGEKTRLAFSADRKLAYLMDGEAIFSKDRKKDKSDFFVSTKLIQAKVSDANILMQTNAETSRVTVLEGSVDVINKLDESMVHLEPGVVLEVKSASAKAASGFHELRSGELPLVDLFQTSKTLSSLFIADPKLLQAHQLFACFGAPLQDAAIIARNLKSIEERTAPLLRDKGDKDLLNMLLLSNATIIAPPASLKYKIGPLVGTAFLLPPNSLAIAPPRGVIGKTNASGILYVMGKHGVLGAADSEIVLETNADRARRQPAVPSEVLKTDTPVKRKRS